MTLLKEFAESVTAPLVMALLLVLLAVALGLAGRSRSRSVLLIVAALLVYLSSIPLVGQALLRPLEATYATLAEEPPPSVGYVVVLGSGYAPHDSIPLTAALDSDGLARIVEGVRLARLLPQSRLVVSGGAPPGRVPAAEGYARLALALGVPERSITVSGQGLDTPEEARALGKLLGQQPFLLVTSAYHMPRAMLLLRQTGANPVAAPTGQRAFGRERLASSSLLPGSAGLGDTERALHEYAGLAAIAGGLQR